MWIIYAIVIHILLLCSIFVIYFRSPVITQLKPQPSLTLPAPAKRLVLIATDGLRADSFFHGNCKDVPDLRQLIKDTPTLVGISHTHVPTESRPGHIALIAGLYEDPSAVTRGWKENPIEFDTIFNRTAQTFAWGAWDVLHIFSRLSKEDEKRMLFDSYNHELDFSGRQKTYELDKWVFDKVRALLQRKHAELRRAPQVIYFLHLLGLDTAGHVHKPGSELFLENLHFTQKGITELYELFEKTFPDKKTAYVLTSDHGMTNSGSHGAGELHETETPFMLWGAGINQNVPTKPTKQYQLDDAIARPLYEIEQAQMAPLMAALLGVAPPMNNFGKLPKDFLNTSKEYEYQAAKLNAYQLLEQYLALLKEHEQGLLTQFLPAYADDINNLRIYMETQGVMQNFTEGISSSYLLMDYALRGIEYYFCYYKWLLLLAITLCFLGWILYLLKLLGKKEAEATPAADMRSKLFKKPKSSIQMKFLAILTLGILGFCLLQKTPWTISFYLLLPTVIWYLMLKTKTSVYVIFDKRQGLSKLHCLLLLVCSELLVYTFFQREAIAFCFLIFILQDRIDATFFQQKNAKFYLGFVMSLLVALSPLLPSAVGYSNNALLYAGIAVTLIRPYIVKQKCLSTLDKIVVILALGNACLCIFRHSQQQGTFLISQIISWSFLFYVLIEMIRPSEQKKTAALKQRLERIIFLLTSLYCLLCTSYESLFLILLISSLVLNFDSTPANCNLNFKISQCFRLSFAILLFTFFSFFGSGNIASISSFDPNIIRCFLTTFSPFVIMFLVVLKLIIPIVLIICIIFTFSPFALHYERQIFITLLLICEVMGLNFLFLVKNQGSWLEIGSSISHFVIMQVTTLVFVAFVYLAKVLLKISKHSVPEEILLYPQNLSKVK